MAQVIYIAGTMRSGTTVLGQVLASHPGALLIGETKPLMLDPNPERKCDCGASFGTCTYWRYVINAVDKDALRASAREVFRIRAIPALLLSVRSHGDRGLRAEPAVEVLRRIAAAAEGAVAVDTSKSPVGVLLWKLAGADVHVVHVIRSPRAVADAQACPSRESGLPQETRVKSFLVWVVYHSLSFTLRPFVRSYTVVRFNAMRAAPSTSFRRVWEKVSPGSTPDLQVRNVFEYGPSHLVVGNPRRSRGGSVEVE